MSVYKELNDLKIDVSEIEEIPLSKNEQMRIMKKVTSQIQTKKSKKKWVSAGLAVAAVCILSLSLTLDKETVASMPFVGEVIEKYIKPNEKLDYSSYKTAIGETAENQYGKLTLNEVMVDDRQLFLSATFEPADHVDFDYKTVIFPKVTINGEDYTDTAGGESIEINNQMFTVYNDINLKKSIDTSDLNIEISYENWDFEKEIEQPWVFNVAVSQEKLLKEKKTFSMDRTITLVNGESITIQKVVTTPMSTAVYYDLSKSNSEDIYFHILGEDGTKHVYTSAFTSNTVGDVSVARFNGVALQEGNYVLITQDSEGNVLSETPIPIE
ncbi:DUF4179 domain-containing protein [Mesobacillus subterraneus]|uniref:DUF4179 domain-containing protein n=1 Tax=Mesobacillus subterraneus TaxID=285983 RepID=A0A3R9F4B5_9BACI|nr:DUF4179 domain-containing protein [Mesobacillus subterraneus]RSD28732.1 DUF4179 domain-containing protein [Mesobacillus subterraneus]